MCWHYRWCETQSARMLEPDIRAQCPLSRTVPNAPVWQSGVCQRRETPRKWWRQWRQWWSCRNLEAVSRVRRWRSWGMLRTWSDASCLFMVLTGGTGPTLIARLAISSFDAQLTIDWPSVDHWSWLCFAALSDISSNQSVSRGNSCVINLCHVNLCQCRGD